MEFVSRGRLLAVVCFVCWTSVSPTAAAINTQGPALWPEYARYSEPSTTNSDTHLTGIPFTYYECITNEVEISYPGFLSFGSSYNSADPPAPAEWPYLPKLLGVYWSRFNSFRNNDHQSLYVHYDDDRLQNVTYENSLIQYIKDVISEPEFEPLVIIAATWENVQPPAYKNDTATFQVLLATDSQVTYAIRGYDSVWQSPELANATYYAATYSLGYGERPHISTPGSHSGPEVIRLGTKKPNKDPYTCVEKTQTVIAHLSSSLNLLPPCPCYEVQAAKDKQFTTSNVPIHCYQSTTPPAGGSLLQLCCYNQYGHLINYTREARVPVSSDPTDHRLQETYEKCCADGSGLCDWFYFRIYMTKRDSYTPAVNRSELPSFITSNDDIVYKRSSGMTFTSLPVRNSTGVTYSMSTTFNSSHGIRLDRAMYSWNFNSALNELRKVSYPQRLVFYATDNNNMSTSYAPIFKLCLCEQDKQCNLNSYSISVGSGTLGMNTFRGVDSYDRGNVNSMVCDCKGSGTGRFCEKPINVCDNCLVNKTSGCDSNPQDYCPPCPLGYQRSGTQCLVITPTTTPTTTPTRTPGGGGNKCNSTYLLIILSFTSYRLWI